MNHRLRVFPEDDDDVVAGLDDQSFESDYEPDPPEAVRNPEPSTAGDTSEVVYRPLTAKMRARGLCGVALRYCDGRKVVFR